MEWNPAIAPPSDAAPIFVLFFPQPFKNGGRFLKHMEHVVHLQRMPHASAGNNHQFVMRNLNRCRFPTTGIYRSD